MKEAVKNMEDIEVMEVSEASLLGENVRRVRNRVRASALRRNARRSDARSCSGQGVRVTHRPRIAARRSALPV